MKTVTTYISLLLGAVFGPLFSFFDRSEIVLGNILAGVWPDGSKTYLSDAAMATRDYLVINGTDENHIAVGAANTEIPLGMCPDTASAAEKQVPILLFGAYKGTMRGVAGANIAVGAMLISAGNGKLLTLPTSGTNGTYYIIGRAIAAATSGNEVSFIPCFPIQRVVT